MGPHDGQKADRLILLTFPFSLQCDSLPLARATATHAYLQTDLSLHYPACLLPPALARKGETRLQVFQFLSLSFTCTHRHVHVYTDQTCGIQAWFLCTVLIVIFDLFTYMYSINVEIRKRKRTENKGRWKERNKQRKRRNKNKQQMGRKEKKKNKEDPTCTTSLHLKESWSFASTPTSFLWAREGTLQGKLAQTLMASDCSLATLPF